MSCAALSVRRWLVLLLLLLCASLLIVSSFPCPFRGRGFKKNTMYRISVKKHKGGKWETMWEDETLGRGEYDLIWMMEKCIIHAYKVEWFDS